MERETTSLKERRAALERLAREVLEDGEQEPVMRPAVSTDDGDGGRQEGFPWPT